MTLERKLAALMFIFIAVWSLQSERELQKVGAHFAELHESYPIENYHHEGYFCDKNSLLVFE